MNRQLTISSLLVAPTPSTTTAARVLVADGPVEETYLEYADLRLRPCSDCAAA